MSAYLQWLLSPSDPFNVIAGLQTVGTLALSSKVFFWLIVFIVVRYDLAAFVLLFMKLVNPRVFFPPRMFEYADYTPLISVLIAGRNPGPRIADTIESVLNSGYPNVELIYADDHSTDESVATARQYERTGKVKIFANEQHCGKPSNLNVAIMLARGEFLFVLDADAAVTPGSLQVLLAEFQDPTVASVSANIMSRNGDRTLITRFQEIEYALAQAIAQIWRSKADFMSIAPGAATMFRATALRAIGGYDTGLGDDTDVTIRLRKAGWRLKFSVEASIRTDYPETLSHLLRQRSRWTRNMVKVRFKKHRDLGTMRYGFRNMLLFYEVLFSRVLLPLTTMSLLVFAVFFKFQARPDVITGLYWFTTSMLFFKVLVARDVSGAPPLARLWLVPFYPFYRLPVRITEVIQILREFLHIKPWHPYVPRRIWQQIPHW
ncbi:MAG: glycosyltransferase family 2 protein [Candidatus Eremiobacteraeota bacterium]|nr:glycosyltransferase family 2 protein [Candidatus Eremiobacteraeota bacterium]